MVDLSKYFLVPEVNVCPAVIGHAVLKITMKSIWHRVLSKFLLVLTDYFFLRLFSNEFPILKGVPI